MLAAIVIIGLASTTITTTIITAHKSQIRGQQYILANEIAKTYDAVLARDINNANKGKSEIPWNESLPKDYVVVGGYDCTSTTGELLQNLTKITTQTGSVDSPIYKYLYSGNDDDCFRLNNNKFDKTNVKIEIYMMSSIHGFYKTRITVKYSTDRQVTYDGTHFADIS